MPIIGHSDEMTRNDNPPSYPLWARVKKGDERPERGPGRNLSYFRFDWVDEKAEKAFNLIFEGRYLDSVFIKTLAHDVDSVFDSHYRTYTSNHVCRIKCNGEKIVKALNRDLVGQGCICKVNEKQECKESGYLFFTIQEMVDVLGYTGQFMLRTGSMEEIEKISSVLQHQYNKVGTLIDHPWLLQRDERTYDQLKDDGTPVQYRQWDVQLIPPSDKIMQETYGIVSSNVYLNEVSIPQLTEAKPQLESTQDDRDEDFVSKKDPVISEDAIAKIDQFITMATGFSLQKLVETMSAITSEVIDYDEINQYTYEQISRNLLENMAVCAIPFRVNSIGYDKGKKRYTIPFLNETVLMFSRDAFRKGLAKAGMSEDDSKAFLGNFDKKQIQFMQDMQWTLEQLAMIEVSEKIDPDTGEHMYFYVDSVRVPDSLVNPDGSNMDDIPF